MTTVAKTKKLNIMNCMVHFKGIIITSATLIMINVFDNFIQRNSNHSKKFRESFLKVVTASNKVSLPRPSKSVTNKHDSTITVNLNRVANFSSSPSDRIDVKGIGETHLVTLLDRQNFRKSLSISYDSNK